jgi:hypothetical protein
MSRKAGQSRALTPVEQQSSADCSPVPFEIRYVASPLAFLRLQGLFKVLLHFGEVAPQFVWIYERVRPPAYWRAALPLRSNQKPCAARKTSACMPRSFKMELRASLAMSGYASLFFS